MLVLVNFRQCGKGPDRGFTFNTKRKKRFRKELWANIITYLLLIQALASTTMERLPISMPRPSSFTVSMACRPGTIFGGGFFRSASQANLSNQVKNINISDSDPLEESNN